MSDLLIQGGAELDAPADPSSSDYPARPEWYFLSLFQMLKLFPGKREVIGTFVIPVSLAVALLLLPFLDQTLATQYRLDEPWDSPNNRRLHARMPAVFRCPADGSPTTSGVTDYVVISGPGAIFDGTQCTKLAEITDGTDQTLLVVEVVESDINWPFLSNLATQLVDLEETGDGPLDSRVVNFGDPRLE